VRIQPNHLSFTSAKAIQDIHGFKAKAVKGELYDNLFQPPGADAGTNMLASTSSHSRILLNPRDVKVHDKFRKLFAPSFKNTAVLRLEPQIQEYLENFAHALRPWAVTGDGMDITLYCKYFTIDVLSQCSSLLTSDGRHVVVRKSLQPRCRLEIQTNRWLVQNDGGSRVICTFLEIGHSQTKVEGIDVFGPLVGRFHFLPGVNKAREFEIVRYFR
jgi:hypothetical protein